jgi:copper chaperone
MDHGTTQLPLADTTAGCACCSGHTTTEMTAITKENPVSTQTFPVTGMTCGHCVSAVTSELKELSGVTDVTVDLVAGGTSTVTLASESPVSEADVAAALDEAGDYSLANN